MMRPDRTGPDKDSFARGEIFNCLLGNTHISKSTRKSLFVMLPALSIILLYKHRAQAWSIGTVYLLNCGDVHACHGLLRYRADSRMVQ